MQMQKKITTKEDGRFLVFYHFPDTATEEETRVFEEIEEEEEEEEKRRRGEEETQSTIGNRQSAIPSSLIPHPSSPEATHV